ncbi:MAG: hybrid sensor histidine kinase/response regulator, partial [Alphaproteobacteria bacterium]
RKRVEARDRADINPRERTRPDGTVISARRDPMPGGGYVTTYTDITERKRVEAELIQSAKLATLGEIAAGMVHELSQPLNIIRFAAEGSVLRMEKGTFGAEDQKRQFETIDSQCGRMAKIIDNMRVFSRKDDAAEEIFDPAESVKTAVDLIEAQFRADGIDISTELPRRASPVHGCMVRLEQVIINLLTNAHDSIVEKRETGAAGSDWGGRIEITARHHEADKAMTISVIDNGLGIPEGEVEKIFQPFYTTKQAGSGTGLGLSVSHGIIEAMAGRLSVRNLDEGARFDITLPCAAVAGGEAATGPSPRPRKPRTDRGRSPCHVLVVEDEPEAAQAMARYLEELGHRVSIAGDGKEACETFSQDPADVVVTDLRMPRMKGEELVKRLRERSPDLPIIAVTGHVGPTEELNEELKAQVVRIFKKPVSLARLGEAVEEIIRSG